MKFGSCGQMSVLVRMHEVRCITYLARTVWRKRKGTHAKVVAEFWERVFQLTLICSKNGLHPDPYVVEGSLRDFARTTLILRRVQGDDMLDHAQTQVERFRNRVFRAMIKAVQDAREDKPFQPDLLALSGRPGAMTRLYWRPKRLVKGGGE